MKNLILWAGICAASFLFSSCDESFEPKTAFDDKYVLYSIIKGDSTVQMASLARTYDVDGFDPLSNVNDPFIKGAIVYLEAGNKTYQMRDTAVPRTDTSRYKGLVNVYYVKGFKPAPNQEVKITAIPKDAGVTLTSKTRVPAGLIFTSSVNYLRESRTNINLSWTTFEPDVIYVPRFKIIYSRKSEIPSKLYSAQIPLSIGTDGVYHYPNISRSTAVYFTWQMIDMMMEKISEGQDKSDFRVYRLELEVLIFDQFLGNYLSSTSGFFDQLSIRLDEPNYTNINNGYGIFGSMFRETHTIGLAESFLSSFGYSY